MQGSGSGRTGAKALASRCQVWGTSNSTGASTSLECTTTSESSLALTPARSAHSTMRHLNSGESTVKVSYSPPSPHGLQP